MNGMENIAELLQSMLAGNDFNGDSDKNGETEDYGKNGNHNGNEDTNNSGGGFDDFFGGIDIDMIMKIGSLFAEMQKPDKNTVLLKALRPMMRSENQEKIDTAMKLMRVMALLPLLRENGMMDKIF